MLTLRSAISSRTLYLVWAAISALALATTSLVDPYVFALAAFVSAGLTAIICLASILVARRRLPWAAASAIPTAVSFVVLSTYSWA